MALLRGPGRREEAYYVALLGLLSVLFFLPFWTLQQVLYQEDIHEMVVPVLHWLHGRYQAGLPVAWMQGLMCGVPVTDAAFSAERYPPTRLILTHFSEIPALLLILWSHALWAAYGCYALVRQQKGSRGAAFFTGVLGGFGGSLVFAQRWASNVYVSLAWAPWALLGLALVQGGRGRQRLAGIGLLALSLGLGFNGGYPGMIVYLVGILAVLHLAWLAEGPGWSEALKSWRSMAAAAVLSVLMAGGPAAAIQRLAPQSMRGEALSVQEAGAASLSPAALAQTFLPDALGRSRDNSFLGMSWSWGSHLPHGMALYLGLLGTFLAAFALFKAPRRHAPWSVALALLLVYALGSHTPFFAALLRLPVLDHLRGTVKAAALGAFVLALPVAWSVDHLHLAPRRAWAGTMALLGAALLLGALALHLDPIQRQLQAYGDRQIAARLLGDALHHQSLQYYSAKLAAWLGVLRGHLLVQGLWALAAAGGFYLVLWRAWPAGLVLGLLLFGELATNGVHYMPRVERGFYERVPDGIAWVQAREASRHEPYRLMAWGWADHLRACFPQGRREGDTAGERRFVELPQRSMPLIQGAELYNGYFPAILRRHEPLHGWYTDHLPATDMPAQTREMLRRRRLWDLGGVKYVFSASPLRAPGLALLREGPPLLYLNRQAAPLAFFAEQASGGWEAAGAEAALLKPGASLRPALVEGPGPFGHSPGRVRWSVRDDARWELDTDNPGDGTLVLSRTYYEGLFEARIDGVKVPLWPANASFCAIAVPAGKHRVQVALKDPLEAWAPWTFSAGLLLALGLMMTPYFKRSDAHG